MGIDSTHKRLLLKSMKHICEQRDGLISQALNDGQYDDAARLLDQQDREQQKINQLLYELNIPAKK